MSSAIPALIGAAGSLGAAAISNGSDGQGSQVVDVTPPQFEGLRGPTANTLRNILQGRGAQAQGPFAAGLAGPEQALLQQLEAFRVPQQAQQQALQRVQAGAPQQTQQQAIQALLQGPQQNFRGQALQDLAQGPQSDFQQQALQQIQGGGGTPQDFRQNLLQQLQGGPSQQLLEQTVQGEFLSPESNPFLQQTIEAAQRPILEQFGDETQALREQFARAGQTVASGGSSPFDMARAELAGNVANALGDVGTRIAGENLARERGLQQQAVNQIMQGLQLGGGVEQQLGQQQLQALGLGSGIEESLARLGLQGTQLGAGIEQDVSQQGTQQLLGAAELEQNIGQRGLQEAQLGAQLEQGIGQQQISTMLENLQAQALPRLIEQMGIDRGLQEFERQQNQLLQSLTIAGGVSSPQATTLPGVPSSGGFAAGIAPALGQQLGQGFAGLFSNNSGVSGGSAPGSFSGNFGLQSGTAFEQIFGGNG